MIDLSEGDVNDHLSLVNIGQDVRLIMNYFVFLLFTITSDSSANEFIERQEEIKGAIIEIMRNNIGAGARSLSALLEAIVKKSLLKDGCIEDAKPYPIWSGSYHDYKQPQTFYQLLEGALRDPRSRIGRVIDYPPTEEIFHVSEMIRNPLAHGTPTRGTLADYEVLFFLLILLFHDIVNPHNYTINKKYSKWIDRTKANLRLGGEEPTLDKIQAKAKVDGLDLEELKRVLGASA